LNGFRCPNCGAGLQRAEAADGVMWVCSSCGGHAVGIGMLRRALDVSFTNSLWLAATERGVASDRSCAVCDRAMVGTDTSPSLEVCKGCRFVWFDPGEFDMSPRPAAGDVAEPALSQEQLEVVGRIHSTEIAEKWRGLPDAEIGDQLAMIPGLLGMPIEEVAPEVRRDPWVTWGLVLLLVLANGVSVLLGDEVSTGWGLVPSDAFRHGGLTFVTSFFLHTGVLHLLTNVYFLWVFGDNVEDFLGRTNFLLLVVVAALTGAAVHALLSPERDAAFLGANAAISALVVFYGLRFPQARLRYFRLFRWLSMPAAAASGVWVLTQLAGARSELGGSSDAPYLAALGGGAIGLWFWFLWRND
jgi:membrane associated rhomboid family serine protease/Zn-finger nucleic acid-binding protein